LRKPQKMNTVTGLHHKSPDYTLHEKSERIWLTGPKISTNCWNECKQIRVVSTTV